MTKNVQTVTIETPEHFELQFQLAGIGSRFIAALIDNLIQFGSIIVLTLLLVGFFIVSEWNILDSQWLKSVVKSFHPWLIALFIFVVSGLILTGYFILFEYFWSGTTPGKRVMSLRVIRSDGRPITFFDSLVRNILRIVDVIGFVYPLGLAVMFLDSRNRRLGDFAAGTLVILERRESGAAERGLLPDAASLAPEIRSAAELMSAADYRLVSKFLDRRGELDQTYREDLAADICHRLMRKSAGDNFCVLGVECEKVLETVESLYRERIRVL